MTVRVQLLLLLFTFLGFPAQTQPANTSQSGKSPILILAPETDEIHLIDYLEILPQAYMPAIQEHILQGKLDSVFIPLAEDDFFNTSHIQGRPTWMKLKVKSGLTKFSEWKVFPISRVHLVDTVEVHFMSEDGQHEVKRTGRSLPLSEKDVGGFVQVKIKRSHYGVTLQLNPGEQKDIYIRIAASPGQSIDLRPTIESLFYFIAQNETYWFRRNLIQGIFHGMLLMFALFNMVSFFTQKDKTYLFYSLFVVSLSIASMCLPGIKMDQVFFPQKPFFLNFLGTVADNCSVIFYLIFLISFLNINKLLPLWEKVIKVILYCHISFLMVRLVFFNLGLFENILAPLNLWIILAIILILCYFFIMLMRTDDRLSHYMVLGSGFIAAGTAIHIMEILGWYTLPGKSDLFPYPSVYFFQAGVILQLITFSLGLGVRARARILEQSKMADRELQRSKFFTDISHEIRTPLNLISDPVRSLLLQSKDEHTTKTLEMVDRNAQRILKLMNDLLDLARLDAGQMFLKAQETEIGLFVKAFAGFFESHAYNKSIEISIETPAEPVLAFVDREKLEIILFNLISNALRHTDPGGLVTMKVVRQQKNVIISVKDTGPGLPKGEEDKLFKRFYTTSNIHTGSGVGLALSRELAELHSGDITARNSPGKGAEFKVRIPLGSQHLLPEQIRAIEDSPTPNLPVGIPVSGEKENKKTAVMSLNANSLPLILVVEDNTDLLEYMNRRLTENSFNVMTAKNGKKGFQLALEFIPDIVISDVVMPVLSGHKLCKKIKTNELTSHIPVILLSGKVETHEIVRGLGDGADVYLTKPFKINELVAYIGNLLSNRELLKQKFTNGTYLLSEATGLTPNDRKFVDKVNKIILENLENEEFEIQDLISSLGISRTQLHRKLKSITDKSASHYIRDFKLEHAHKLLQQTDKNVSEAADMVGFKDLSYFSKCFKEKFGFSPSSLKQ